MFPEGSLEKCPHMSARCPHKEDRCRHADSRNCHYILAAYSEALTLAYREEDLPRRFEKRVRGAQEFMHEVDSGNRL